MSLEDVPVAGEEIPAADAAEPIEAEEAAEVAASAEPDAAE